MCLQVVSNVPSRLILPVARRRNVLGRHRHRPDRLITMGVQMLHHEASGGMTDMMHMVRVSIEDPLPREEAVDLLGRVTGLQRDRF